MKIIHKSRGSEIPKQAQRVFLIYSGSNVDARDTIISDLHSMDAGMDCVVSYIENPDAAIDENELQNEFSQIQLLVIWVTMEMLQSITPKELPREYSIAREFHIPVLPILKDDGLFQLYNEKFGSTHCIAKLGNEYRIKLKAQMDILLASEEIIEHIREKAFTATLFMSYRKHELGEARRFMKAFHDLEGFESVSIWYDKFLTAGRDFDKDIIELIRNSGALVLVVTPDLATDGNYVQREEYPFARKIGKPVVPVEVIPTSQEQFSKLFPGTGHPIPLDDTITLQAVFRKTLSTSAFVEQLGSERAYLLGMAYLKEINVERDVDRAVRLLEVATENYTMSSIDAANQLASIYENGTWTNINFDKALHWHQNALAIYEKVLGKEHLYTATTYNNMAEVYSQQEDYTQALELHQKALKIREKVLGKEHPYTATTYSNIALVYHYQGNYAQALEWNQKALIIREKVLGKDHPDTGITYNNMAGVHDSQGDYAKALEWYHKDLEICEKLFGKEHPDTAATYNNIAGVYENQGDYAKALELYKKALVIYEKVFGKDHPDTIAAYNNIAGVNK